MQWHEWTLWAIAVAGFGLSLLSLWQQKKDRSPDIRVTASASRVISADDPRPHFLRIHAAVANHGQVDVSITKFQFRPDRGGFSFSCRSAGGWPRTLAPRHHVEFEVDENDVNFHLDSPQNRTWDESGEPLFAGRTITLMPCVEDALGRRYEGTPFSWPVPAHPDGATGRNPDD